LPATVRAVPADSIEHIRRSRRSGFYDATRLVVRDSASWRAIWAWVVSSPVSNAPLLPPPAEPPAVDFARQMVIVVALGQRGCGDETVGVDSLYQDRAGLGLFVIVRTRDEGARPRGMGCAGESVTPVDVVRVPLTVHSVHFVERGR